MINFYKIGTCRKSVSGMGLREELVYPDFSKVAASSSYN